MEGNNLGQEPQIPIVPEQVPIQSSVVEKEVVLAPNKKGSSLPLILMFIATIIIAVGCFFAYKEFAKKPEEAEVIKEEKIMFTESEYPRIDGSTATQPLADAYLKNFTGNKDATGVYNKTHQAYVNLINKEVDLILVTEPSAEELQLAKDKGMELEVIPVVNEAFVFYVNHNNKVNNLTLDQIRDIYAGKIKNWNEVGGDNVAIRAFQRPVNSGSQTGMLSMVMKDTKLMAAPKEDIIETMEAIIGLVSSYDNDSNAIGYSYYYYATTMYDTIDKEVTNKIKFIGVDGVQPSTATIKNGTYPLRSNYYIVIDKATPENSNTRKLVKAMLSERGQQIAEAVGYVGIK